MDRRFVERFVIPTDTVRMANEHDIYAICRFYEALDAEDPDGSIDLSAVLGDPTVRVWMLEREGVTIGQIVTRDDGDALAVAGLYVIPEARRPGTALALFRLVYEQARGREVRFYASNERLARVYKALGARYESGAFALEVDK